MSQFIPPPFKIEFPEQIALSDRIDGERSDVAASELAVSRLKGYSQGISSDNLLINPRGKINQANDTDGVLASGQYFCDGWKAGPNGAEVYRDALGFRLVTGSIVQLVPNTLDADRVISGNLEVISGVPIIKINGGADIEQSNNDSYITFEVVGNNSRFTRLILAESESPPIYKHTKDELTPCLSFFCRIGSDELFGGDANGLLVDAYHLNSGYYTQALDFPRKMISTPAVSVTYGSEVNIRSKDLLVGTDGVCVRIRSASSGGFYCYVREVIADARP